MELKVKHIFLTVVLCLFSLFGHAQTHPPEPRMNQDPGSGPGTPCDQPDGTGTQPPVGLCLPIDDYIYPFLVLAILYGAYKINQKEAAKNIKG